MTTEVSRCWQLLLLHLLRSRASLPRGGALPCKPALYR